MFKFVICLYVYESLKLFCIFYWVLFMLEQAWIISPIPELIRKINDASSGHSIDPCKTPKFEAR